MTKSNSPCSIAEIITWDDFQSQLIGIDRNEPSVPCLWGINVKQIAPSKREHDALLHFNKKDAERISSILKKYNDKTRSFISIHRDHLMVRTDLRYNTYSAYHDCFCELAKLLSNTIFYVIQDEENDNAQVRFIADRYKIESKMLCFNRIFSGYGVGEEDPHTDKFVLMNNLYRYFGGI